MGERLEFKRKPLPAAPQAVRNVLAAYLRQQDEVLSYLADEVVDRDKTGDLKKALECIHKIKDGLLILTPAVEGNWQAVVQEVDRCSGVVAGLAPEHRHTVSERITHFVHKITLKSVAEKSPHDLLDDTARSTLTALERIKEIARREMNKAGIQR